VGVARQEGCISRVLGGGFKRWNLSPGFDSRPTVHTALQTRIARVGYMQTLDVHCVNSRAEDCFVDGAIFNVLYSC